MPIRDLLLTLFVTYSATFSLARPYVGVLLCTWLGYMSPHRFTWGFANDIPFYQIALICTFIGLFFSAEEKRFPFTPVTVMLIALLAWCGLTTLFAFYPENAFALFIKFSKIAIGLMLTLYLANSHKRINQLIWVIVLSLGFFGVKGGIFTILTGGDNGMVLGPSGSFIQGNTELGLAMVMAFPFMYYLFQETNKKWIRYGLLVAAFLTAVAVIGTTSRGAFLGLAVTCLFFWWRSQHKFLLGLIILLGFFAFLPFMPESWFAKMGTIQNYEQDSSAMGRILTWQMATNMAMDNLFGGGFAAWTQETFMKYSPGYNTVHVAHSIYFQMIGEHGFVGLVIFLLFHVLAWLKANKIRRLTKRNSDYQWAYNLASATQVSLIGYYSAGAFLSLAFFDFPYHIVCIIVVLGCLVEKEVEVKDRVRVPVMQPG